MRGTRNQNLAITNMENYIYFTALFDMGLVGIKSEPFVSCFPDGGAVLFIEELLMRREWGPYETINLYGVQYPLEIVELNTRASSYSFVVIIGDVPDGSLVYHMEYK